jgi:pilus assembly protein Flp/PilA
MAKFFAAAKSLVRSEEGASMVEYGLLVALIALVVAAAATTLGNGIAGLFTRANGSL